ncbi:PhnD/SsuA/transferrin family substrate-binding protein [Sulfitobacter sp. M57]|uniref:phosphate/phosphite/phosphonate ABC transporter substrate-binding protein n=2 Tax=unclassified Sulfitobacter TaxID=196795 RepID=UPI0023E1A010|nr:MULTISPECIES: PhnD/SsuA/transferrin family substrate-binding protein [unclassified Sulfitobacter]MDF3521819.1 PhnD/SsuA/transferrin family substrate-binding protein [Sulfitobacter sp. M74]MDF3545246.1 PhnD/SsuA/transferrin family substrate-binding protein [Sulfitobacter sp. M72]MDF3415385.1 PhnD/SsuA/transferrin family substrate-binding protein [Sulfitobacter sp. KE5]MDF3422866.1 PhnD/SsuA/transferrin family substrate-binding protein [Sulfitobacter sp. KE43]MDF3433931.1 PhnD/SsuA/transferri
MTASLMMYARPELEAANNAYWAALREALSARGIDTPAKLDNARDTYDLWLSPDLVFSQTCGMPYRTRLADHVTLIGTPDFALEGCPAGFYNSVVVVRANDSRETPEAFADARFVFNQACSQSGFAAAYFWAREHGFWFNNRRASGGHVQSARMVADGAGDIAVLDAQTWRLIQRFDRFAKALRVIDTTAPTPGLPYIAAKDADQQVMFNAVSEAIAQLDSAHRTALDLKGLIAIPQTAYLAVENPPV